VPKLYRYKFIHLPSGKQFESAQMFRSETDFLQNVNKWNQTPQWKYWATDTLGEYVPEGVWING
jgi:hypothetical protein